MFRLQSSIVRSFRSSSSIGTGNPRLDTFSRSSPSSRSLPFSHLAITHLHRPRLAPSQASIHSPSSLGKRSYSLWPFGSRSPTTDQASTSEKSPSPIPPSPSPQPTATATTTTTTPDWSSSPTATTPLIDSQLAHDTLLPTPTISSASQELTALELEHGFLARYTSGSIEKILCSLHDQLALPWYLTIPVVIVSIRALLIPINVWSMGIGARNMQIKPSIDQKISIIKELQTRGQPQQALSAQNELRAYMKQEGFRPLAPLGLPLLQGSLFVSFFWALREMGNHHLPSLTTEGTLWFTDLTLAGPWYGLPLIASTLTLLSVETASEMGGLKAGQSQKVMWFLRAVIVGTLWLFHNLPSAVFLYWCTNNMFSLIWGTFIRLIPSSLKLKLRIPDTTAINAANRTQGSTSPSFLDGFKAAVSDPAPSTSPDPKPSHSPGSPPPPIVWKNQTKKKKKLGKRNGSPKGLCRKKKKP